MATVCGVYVGPTSAPLQFDQLQRRRRWHSTSEFKLYLVQPSGKDSKFRPNAQQTNTHTWLAPAGVGTSYEMKSVKIKSSVIGCHIFIFPFHASAVRREKKKTFFVYDFPICLLTQLIRYSHASIVPRCLHISAMHPRRTVPFSKAYVLHAYEAMKYKNWYRCRTLWSVPSESTRCNNWRCVCLCVCLCNIWCLLHSIFDVSVLNAQMVATIVHKSHMHHWKAPNFHY